MRGSPERSSHFQQEALGSLDTLLDAYQKADRLAAVNEAMIIGQGHVHHGPDHHLIVDGDGTLLNGVHPKDAALRRIEDRCAQETAEDSAIGDGESTSLKIVDSDLALAGLLRQRRDVLLDLGEALAIDVADDRHHQSPLGADGNTEIVIIMV